MERSPRQYVWTAYRQLLEVVRGHGLKLQVVLSFHACGGNVGDSAVVPLPSWVLEVRRRTAGGARPVQRTALAACCRAGAAATRCLSASLPACPQAGRADPDIFFTDRPRGAGCGAGCRHREALSIWADDAPVLPPGGRTPLGAYADFMSSFRDAFRDCLGSLIEEVVVGAGPCGELR